jgi:hypothetical protein
VFAGLFITLWVYKCIAMVVFQNKIVYLPYLPPHARSEKIADYAGQLRRVSWREHQVVAVDGTRITLAMAVVPFGLASREKGSSEGRGVATVIVYFQGWVIAHILPEATL